MKMLRQQQRRDGDKTEAPLQEVDYRELPCELQATTDNELRVELALLKEQVRVEEERLSQLITGQGKGRGKSLQFQFAARTFLATGCSARSARDQMLVSAQLFLSSAKFILFEHQVPSERWFRYQRKGLGYEAWLYSMLRVANCEAILQWGFDETSLDGTPTLNQWVLIQESMCSPSIVTIECCGLLVGSTSEEIAEHIRASWLTGKHLPSRIELRSPSKRYCTCRATMCGSSEGGIGPRRC